MLCNRFSPGRKFQSAPSVIVTRRAHCRAPCRGFGHTHPFSRCCSYVQSLLQRTEELQRASLHNRRSATQASSVVADVASMADEKIAVTSPSTSNSTFDVLVPAPASTGVSHFWGSSSVISLTVEILQHAVTRGLLSADALDVDHGFLHSDGLTLQHDGQAQSPAVDDAEVESLVDAYLRSLNTLYRFVDPVETSVDLAFYLAVRGQPNLSVTSLPGTQMHQFFRITMMCAIACASNSRHRPRRGIECFAYYSSAASCIEEVTSAASPAALQALLLLIIFYLFQPREGDLWKLLDYACRMAIELGYHAETQVDQSSAAEPETDAQRKRRRSTFWGLYAIERILGQLCGRGSDLPETIITTEYPDTLQTDMIASTTDSAAAETALQTMSIAHHYRLVYLRSEIYRALYLPITPTSLTIDWLQDQLASLRAWRQELVVSDDMAGVATLTCDVGYDATICFLFQPLLLRALRRGSEMSRDKTSNNEDSAHNSRIQEAVVDQAEARGSLLMADSFHSAASLVKTYEKIIRAPERSATGLYPMTIMSAHYIYLACSTLLAHALLRIQGRSVAVEEILRGGDDTSATRDAWNAGVDWGLYVDISSSSLLLLSWCADRWPGLRGMLFIYQDLMRETIRQLVRQNLVC